LLAFDGSLQPSIANSFPPINFNSFQKYSVSVKNFFISSPFRTMNRSGGVERLLVFR
jgi:hypothetical protein